MQRQTLVTHTHTHTRLLSIHQSKRLISAYVGVDEKEIRKFSMHIVRLIKRPKVTSSQVGWVRVSEGGLQSAVQHYYRVATRARAAWNNDNRKCSSMRLAAHQNVHMMMLHEAAGVAPTNGFNFLQCAPVPSIHTPRPVVAPAAVLRLYACSAWQTRSPLHLVTLEKVLYRW